MSGLVVHVLMVGLEPTAKRSLLLALWASANAPMAPVAPFTPMEPTTVCVLWGKPDLFVQKVL